MATEHGRIQSLARQLDEAKQEKDEAVKANEDSKEQIAALTKEKEDSQATIAEKEQALAEAKKVNEDSQAEIVTVTEEKDALVKTHEAMIVEKEKSLAAVKDDTLNKEKRFLMMNMLRKRKF